MEEGIYSISFGTGSPVRQFGIGLAVVQGGRIHGGDHSYMYMGAFTQHDSKITGEIAVRHYHGSQISVFGPRSEFKLAVFGETHGPDFQLSGDVIESPPMAVTIQGHKLAELHPPLGC